MTFFCGRGQGRGGGFRDESPDAGVGLLGVRNAGSESDIVTACTSVLVPTTRGVGVPNLGSESGIVGPLTTFDGKEKMGCWRAGSILGSMGGWAGVKVETPRKEAEVAGIVGPLTAFDGKAKMGCWRAGSILGSIGVWAGVKVETPRKEAEVGDFGSMSCKSSSVLTVSFWRLLSTGAKESIYNAAVVSSDLLFTKTLRNLKISEALTGRLQNSNSQVICSFFISLGSSICARPVIGSGRYRESIKWLV